MHNPFHASLWRTISAVTLAALAGCATVDFDYPKPESYAIEGNSDTFLDGLIQPYEDTHPGQSGFILLTDGIDALAARLYLATQAQKTIDAQYYLITDDSIGYVFVGALLDAADRGVRVRLLVDDIQTAGYDTGLAALDSHPNFEVRVFNPFAHRKLRFADGITSFSRINRRMHNKSFTADNEASVVGGRNIADEYFGARSDVNFGDVDVLGIGPVVREVSNMFDTYWNHESAAPIPAFADMPENPEQALSELRAKIILETEVLRKSVYAEALLEDYRAYTGVAMEKFTWAEFDLAWDSPDKVYKKVERQGDLQRITSKLKESIDSAQSNLILVSPYFVPRKRGEEYLLELAARDVEVMVITNSLAATNHTIVHSGYAPSRKKLLRGGIELREVRFSAGLDGIERGGTGAELATLHTKAFVVDCHDLFIGSFNWDPRSAYINTELGVIIKSPELGSKLCNRIESVIDEKTYDVILNEKNDVRWVDRSNQEEVIYTKEPDTGWWTRFKVGFQQFIPIKGQL